MILLVFGLVAILVRSLFCPREVVSANRQNARPADVDMELLICAHVERLKPSDINGHLRMSMLSALFSCTVGGSNGDVRKDLLIGADLHCSSGTLALV